MWTRRFFIFFQLLLNTGFHRITLGQSDSAPTGAPSIHWMPELVVDEPEPLPCPAWPCWPTVTDWLTDQVNQYVWFEKFIHKCQVNWIAYFFGGQMKENPNYYIVYSQASQGGVWTKKVPCSITLVNHKTQWWMIHHTWMDDIEIGTNVFVASAWQDCFLIIATNWKAKNECWALLHTMSTPQLQVLLSKHDNNHCAMLYKHWCAWFWFLKTNIYSSCQS